MRNSAYIMGTTVVTSLLGYVFWVVAARTYASRDVGLAAALVSALMLASTLSTLGLGPALIQLLPSSDSDRSWSLTLNACLAASLVIGLLVGVCLAVGLPLISPQFSIIGNNPVYQLVLLLGAPVWALTLLIDSTFQAQRSCGKTLARNTVFSILKILVLVLPLLVARPGGAGIMIATVIAAAASYLFAWIVLIPRLERDHTWVIHGLLTRSRSIATTVVSHHFINLGGMAPMYLLPVLVTVRLSASQNAYFYTTWMLGSVFFMISSSVAGALFAEGSHDAAHIGHRVRISLKLIRLLLPAMLLVYLAIGHSVLALFGTTYARNGWTLLLILMLSAAPDTVTNLYVSVLRVHRRLRDASRLNLGMAASTLFLAWVLLPRLGLIGAGWAWLSGQCLGCLWVGFDLVRRRPARTVSAAVRGVP